MGVDPVLSRQFDDAWRDPSQRTGAEELCEIRDGNQFRVISRRDLNRNNQKEISQKCYQKKALRRALQHGLGVFEYDIYNPVSG